MKDYKPSKARKGDPSRLRISLVVIIVVVLIVVSLFYYSRTPTSNVVYCGILQYAVFTALSITAGHTFTQNHTISTMVTYVTTTNVSGAIGRTMSNSSTSSVSGYQAGVETICRYISTPSSTPIANSTTTTK